MTQLNNTAIHLYTHVHKRLLMLHCSQLCQLYHCLLRILDTKMQHLLCHYNKDMSSIISLFQLTHSIPYLL